MSRKSKTVESVVDSIVQSPEPNVTEKSPWGYIVVVVGNAEDPDDRDTTVCGPEDTKNLSMVPSNHIPLYYIRGKNWTDCMRAFHEIQGFEPYKEIV